MKYSEMHEKIVETISKVYLTVLGSQQKRRGELERLN
jgi:hypothetical protein